MRLVNIFLSMAIGLVLFSCVPPGGHCPGEDDQLTTQNCSVQPDAGPCEAHITKYYYDAKAGKCKEFVWGGCQGTVPFHTLKDCEECSGTGPSESDNHNEGIFGGFN